MSQSVFSRVLARHLRLKSVARVRATALLTALLVVGCTDGTHLSPCEEALGISFDACTQVEGLLLPEALPLSPGNALADDIAAAELGFRIFYDARFSSNQDVRCATCHEPEAFFDDDLRVSTSSLGTVTRNSPTVLNAAWLSHGSGATIFWDGRTDSLWSQPLFAFEAANEMDFSRLEVAHRVRQSYRASYEGVFGALPPLDDTARFPASGKPGEAAFDAMADDDRMAVNGIAGNIGKALDAYMRKLATGRSRFDDALALGFDKGLEGMSDAETRGLALFATSGCLACHSGPLLSDSAFHNAGVPAVDGEEPDRGRADGAAVLAAAREDINAFTLTSAFADPPPGGGAHEVLSVAELRNEANDAASLGAIRTPTLRNLAYSAPYGHNGRYETLDAMLVEHLAGGATHGFLGTVDPLLEEVVLSDDERADLIAFLLALDGSYPLPPWNNWPDR